MVQHTQGGRHDGAAKARRFRPPCPSKTGVSGRRELAGPPNMAGRRRTDITAWCGLRLVTCVVAVLSLHSAHSLHDVVPHHEQGDDAIAAAIASGELVIMADDATPPATAADGHWSKPSKESSCPKPKKARAN